MKCRSGLAGQGIYFSFEPSGIKPDIIAMAKGLAGGFPIGAVITTDQVASAMTPGSHGSTFGGNPLAMQAALAVMDVLDEAFLADMRKRSAMLFSELETLKQNHRAIVDIRGNGFLIRLVLADDLTPADIMASCRQHHHLSCQRQQIRFGYCHHLMSVLRIYTTRFLFLMRYLPTMIKKQA